MRTKLASNLAFLAIILALCLPLQASPPPPPTGTTVSIPVGWLVNMPEGTDINSWLAGKGYTVVSRTRSNRKFSVGLAETLDQGQKDTLAADIEAALNSVKFE